MAAAAAVNSPEAIDARLAESRIPRSAPLLVLGARPALALLAQALAVLLLAGLEAPRPAVAARHWWTVYGTLVDLGCLALLLFLTRREGIRLLDLVSFDRARLGRDVLLGLGLFLVVFPFAVIGGGAVARLAAYGTLQPDLPEAALVRSLPFWAVVYSRVVWWPIWSLTEELVYQGYALPRLESLTCSSWLPVGLVAFAWSLQHAVLPWIGPRHGLFLFLTFLPLTITMQLVYRRVRRLSALVVGHGLMDLASVLLLLQSV